MTIVKEETPWPWPPVTVETVPVHGQTVMSKPVSADRAASSVFQARVRQPVQRAGLPFIDLGLSYGV
ncbi:hypothetical protein ACH4GE_36675 [Streptomyces tendae]|uniref:hypothetical protein n=1 Tax=Streptomyces tendae TaxID=1932 RepID=UPI0037A75B4B